MRKRREKEKSLIYGSERLKREEEKRRERNREEQKRREKQRDEEKRREKRRTEVRVKRNEEK
jgi:hypothetical protein